MFGRFILLLAGVAMFAMLRYYGPDHWNAPKVHLSSLKPAQGPVVYQPDLAPPDVNLWDRGAPHRVRFVTSPSGLRADMTGNVVHSVAIPQGPIEEQLSTTATATFGAHAQALTGFGTLCGARVPTGDAAFQFELDRDGRWAITHMVASDRASVRPVAVLAWGRSPHAASDGSHSVEGVCVTPTDREIGLTMFVDGRQVDSITQQTPPMATLLHGGLLMRSTKSGQSVTFTRVVERDAGQD